MVKPRSGTRSFSRHAANHPYRLPPRMFDARCKACWFVLALLLLVGLSFWSLNLQWAAFLSLDALRSMGRFIGEFFPPDFSAGFVRRVVQASWETFAMSGIGTLLAVLFGLMLALPASRTHPGDRALARAPTRLLLNALRAVPELVWAALLLISAGLGPLAGTLALALHTTGVLGRLFAESIENAPPESATALRTHGIKPVAVFFYATLPQVLPQIISYTLYRWENNIRAAAILGVVGAGGLGQLLAFHLGLFQMGRTATVLIAMLLLVAIVDGLSYWMRRALSR